MNEAIDALKQSILDRRVSVSPRERMLESLARRAEAIAKYELRLEQTERTNGRATLRFMGRLLVLRAKVAGVSLREVAEAIR